jgi:hypothetical protein
MTEAHPDHVEMRKLESLSNTIFGVVSFRLSHIRHFQSRKIPTDRAYLIHCAGIGAAQVARGFDRGFFACAIHEVQSQQLLLGFGKRTVEHDA